MTNPASVIATELNLQPARVEAVLELLKEGGTVPFIARYRKERTGALDEVQIRTIQERSEYLAELDERKTAVLKSIEEQGKLEPALKEKIEKALTKNEVEDLYLPFKPKRRTRATIAKERGLEPLAELIWALADG
ncbi:MAG TPA: Tex-like N-terminal domain-containing protein, partial [bacterium]|nr:Tex-like N-terminal domain-containing protein [bacterium]